MWKKTGVVALLIAAIAALTLTSVGFGESPSGGSPDAAARIAAGVAEARAQVGALRRPRVVADDAIAPGVAAEPILEGGIVNSSSSRLARSRGRPIWLANSSDGTSVCQITTGALACPPVSEIAERGLSPALVTRAGEPAHVSGIAADSVRTVDVVFGDGDVQTVTVADNLFALDVSKVPTAVRWIGPNGPESYEFPPVPGG
jgi:hypothetical protein